MAKPNGSILGLAFEGETLTACLARRAGGGVVFERPLRIPLSLDLLNDDAELVGCEIRNALQAAGIRERRCVVALPPGWALTARAAVPENLPAEDETEFLALEAEREFPYHPEDLSIETLRGALPDGSAAAFFVGVPLNRLEALRAAFAAAGLRLQAATLALPALLALDAEAPRDGVALRISEKDADLAILVGGRIAALRRIEDVVHLRREGRALDAETLLREVRIASGRLGLGADGAALPLRLYGQPEAVSLARDALAAPAGELGFEVRDASKVPAGAQEEVPPHGAAAAGAWWLSGLSGAWQFLPERPSRWQRLSARLASGGIIWLAAAAGGVAVLLLVAFGAQWFMLRHYEKRWIVVEDRTQELEVMQDRIRRFRVWYDEAPRSLEVLKTLTLAFPEEGTVWARSLEIETGKESEGPLLVSCSGMAREERAWLATLEALRKSPGVGEVAVRQIVGDAPLQFVLEFEWTGER